MVLVGLFVLGILANMTVNVINVTNTILGMRGSSFSRFISCKSPWK